ncbi:TolC family protein, partial [Paraburkholderia sp. SIMBA_055]
LVDQALRANQSIAAAEAAYRLALATVEANRAGLFPTVTAGLSGARSGGNVAGLSASRGSGASTSTSAVGGAGNSVVALGAVTWELDLWGQIR